MRGGRIGPTAGAMLLILALGQNGWAAPLEASELRRLREAVERIPDDPDLSWALAGALREAGALGEALERFRRIETRWPRLRAEASLEIGSILYEQGRYAAALDALDTSLELKPLLATARMYRALTLQELDRVEEAERELRSAARLEPELEAETLLLLAIQRLERGAVVEGRGLLREVIELDSDGEAGERAARLLSVPQERRAGEPRFTIFSRVGAEHDSNVTLDSGTSLAGISTDETDVRLSWGAGFAARLFTSERGAASLGYAYDETGHEDLKTYDLRTHRIFGSVAAAGPGPLSFRLDGTVLDVHRDDDRYLRSWRVRPNLFLPFGKKVGLSRIYVEAERRHYNDAPTFSSLDRDGTTYALGADHYSPIPGWQGGVGTLGIRLSRTNTVAKTDFLGLDGDYDNRRLDLSGQLRFPLGRRGYVRVGGLLAWERYPNRSVIDLLTDEGVGTPTPSRRREAILGGTAALGWVLSRDVRVELRWRGERHHSNVDVYDYERHVLGLHFVARRSIR